MNSAKVHTLFSIGIWIYWAVCMILCFGLVTAAYLLTFFFDPYHQVPNRMLKGLAWIMLKINPGWSFTIRGADASKVEHPTIVVSNHQSFLDMPLTYLLPWSMKWVAKNSLFRIPVLGWMIAMTGHIGIDRQSRRSVKKLDKLVRPIRDGIPGMIFPEGTRTPDGKLRPFKNGAFVLAKQYNFKVLPVVLEGGYAVMPAGSWKLNPRQQFIVSVLEPIEPDEFESAAAMNEKAFAEIHKELKQIHNEYKNR